MTTVQRANPEHQKHTGRMNSILRHAAGLEKDDGLKKKILIIDDNDFILEMLTQVFEQKHFGVVTAHDGREGLALAESELPDLIIADFNMPHLNGAQLIARLRTHEKFREVPIIVITAYGHWAAAQVMEAGADRTMIKPIEPEQLIESVNELLS